MKRILLSLLAMLMALSVSAGIRVLSSDAQLGVAKDVHSAASGVQQSSDSRIETGVVSSKILGADKKYNVYLPKDYDLHPERYYPVLYLLH